MIDPAAHAVGRALPVRRAHQQSSRALRRSPTRRPATTDLTLKGDLAESWQGSPDQRVWTFKLRQGVKWQNVPPLNGRELVAADVKYCFEAYAKEGVQAFTFQEIEGMETPDKHTLRVHLKTPNALFPQNVAEPVAVIFAREVLEEDGDLKKRMIGTGPYILKEHTRKVRVVLAAQPRLLRQGPPVRRRVRHPLDAGLRHPHGGVPHRPERLPAAAEPVRGGDRPQDESHRRRAGAHDRRSRRSGWRWPRTSRRSTTCACAAPSRWPSTARSRWTRCSRATASSAAGVP